MGRRGVPRTAKEWECLARQLVCLWVDAECLGESLAPDGSSETCVPCTARAIRLRNQKRSERLGLDYPKHLRVTKPSPCLDRKGPKQ